MKLSYKFPYFRFHCDCSQRNIPKSAEFMWHDSQKVWVTSSLPVAMRLRDYADSSAQYKFASKLITVTPWPHELPLPKGQKLDPEQPAAVRWALERNRCYLDVEMGVGKTIIAATICNALAARAPGPLFVTYICPPHLVETVREEFRKWHVGPIFIFNVIKDTELHLLSVQDTIKAHLDKTRVLIVDEADYFISRTSRRTRALLGFRGRPGIADMFDKVVYMSGTPLERTKDLFPILNHSAPEVIGFRDLYGFAKRYCAAFHGEYGLNFDGDSNTEELFQKMTEKFMLVVTKKNAKLPPKREEILLVDKTMSKKSARLQGDLLGKYTLKQLQTGKGLTKNDKVHRATLVKMHGLEAVPAAIAHAEKILETTDESLLVFAVHTDVVAALAEGLAKYKPFVIIGGVPMNKRHEMVKAFQRGERRLFIGNSAMSRGITLTRASRVLTAEPNYRARVVSQMVDRAHRRGQKLRVLVQHLVLKNSLGCKVMTKMLSKRKVQRKLLKMERTK